MLQEIALTYHKPFLPFRPYAPIADRTAWESLDAEWQKEAVRLGENYLHFSYPALSAADFMDYYRTGNRVRYEDKFFIKRLALDALVLAECVEDKGRFLDDIVNGIFSICEESGWQLPAHNSYHRQGPNLPLPDAAEPVLDLFACETGAVLAAVHYLLASVLDERSPLITKRIRTEIEHRIIKPYLERHFWWMGNGREPMNNWTIWCTQNVLLSVFLLEQSKSAPGDDELLQRIFKKACLSADYFLEESARDGCCDEGAQYYRHAGLCLFNTLELLNAITDNAFLSLYKEAKIKNIAGYIANVHVNDEYYVNFADCSPIAGRAGTREFLFGLRTENISMAKFAALDFLAGGNDTLLLPSENNLYYRLQNAFTVSDMRKFADSPAAVSHPDIYYPGVGLFIARDSSFFLAVKAGHNGDGHNHNDTGSFIVYKGGQPLFIDVGVESYTQKTFSAQRYEIWTMQSSYHNLPTIDGIAQKDGREYCASNVEYTLDEQVCEIRMDIGGAYPKETGLEYYIRQVTLEKEREITVKDRFSFTDNSPASVHNLTLNLMTYERPVPIAEESFLHLQIGALSTLAVAGAKLLAIEPLPITDARLMKAWKHDIYRIILQAEKTEVTLRILPA